MSLVQNLSQHHQNLLLLDPLLSPHQCLESTVMVNKEQLDKEMLAVVLLVGLVTPMTSGHFLE
jgi:hypothetical protein